MKTMDEVKAMIAATESELINMPDEQSHNKKKQIAHNNVRDHLRIQRATLMWLLKTTPPKVEDAASRATTMEQGAEGSSAVTMAPVEPDETKSK